MILKAVKIAQQ